MCYLLYLSTSCPDDLSIHNSPLLQLEKAAHSPEILSHPHRWFISYRGGCSCGLRHEMDATLGFTAPADWLPEDPETLAVTAVLYRVVRALVDAGHDVDCVDTWNGALPDPTPMIEVDLDRVSEVELRFFEGHRFVFAKNDRAGGSGAPAK